MNPQVSVIIPVYNTEEYLEECLNSVIFQTLKDIEIIIVNDASPDNSLPIINQFLNRDDRIILIDKKINEGVGKARNDGILRASGEFVCFMDSDDLYPNECVLQTLYELATIHKVSVAGGRRESISNEQTQINSNPIMEYGLSFYQKGLMAYQDFQYDYGYTCYIFEREMLINNHIFFPMYLRFQDPPFFVKAMYAAEEFYFTEESVYRYRLLPNTAKYTMKKTMDMLSGIMDNLAFSKERGLAKLHYLSACRLDTEGSFMATSNLFKEDNDGQQLLYKLILANSMVDVEWIKEQGYDIKEPFVLDSLQYTYDLAKRYDCLRNRKVIKAAKRIIGKK